jgi:DNA-binding transcriptional LysR family regulator
MDLLNNMRVFCRIVELKTFAAVAKEMKVSPMMISKYMAQLEKTLGVTLLNRTTRSVNLTEAGEMYYARSKTLLDELAEINELATQMGGNVQGELRICAPIDFGGIYMVPVIEAFQKQYPDVKISMSLDNRYQNLRDGVFDLVIVITDCLDPGVVARKITQTELGTYASPEYLQHHGQPVTPDDLSDHQCLHYINTPHGDFWIFQKDGQSYKVKHQWFFATNNGRALSQAALLGMGIMRAPKLSVQNDLDQGRLVEILTEFRTPSLSVYVTYLQKRFHPAKLTSFVEFMLNYFRTR